MEPRCDARVARAGASAVYVDLGTPARRESPGLGLTHRSWVSFVAFNVGFYLSYLLVGLSQESIYTKQFDGKKFTAPAFLVFTVFVTNALVSFTVISQRKMVLQPLAPWRSFASLALSHGLSLWCANRAMLYLDYPTQTLFKSCKPLPVFLMGLLCFRHGYSIKRGIPVLFVTVGLCGFMYLKVVSEKGTFSKSGPGWKGTAFVCCALSLDGVTGYLQDLICKGFYTDSHKRSIAPWHLMLFVNLFSASYALAVEVVTGELIPTAVFVVSHGSLLTYIVAFALTSALGQLFVYYLVSAYDSLTCSIVTTLRKFLTIVLSIFWFGHMILPLQWAFIFTVFAGIGIEVFLSNANGSGAAKSSMSPAPTPPGDR
eukprot:m51a1_g5483 hypothetical protein (371) ;mRNA; f:313744-315177